MATAYRNTRPQSLSEVVRAGLRKLEEDEIKLQVLKEKLQAGEDSPLVDSFNGESFIEGLHKKHLKEALIKSCFVILSDSEGSYTTVLSISYGA